MGFGFPSASSVLGVYQSRAYLTRSVPIPGFRNLLPVCSSAHLAGLFHPADTPGIHPPELSPRDEPSALPVARCPPGIAFLTNRCPRNSRFAGAADFDLGFVVGGPVGCLQGLTPVCELVADRTVLPETAARCSPGFLSSLGFHRPGDGSAFAVPPLLRLPRRPPRLPWFVGRGAFQSFTLPVQ